MNAAPAFIATRLRQREEGLKSALEQCARHWNVRREDLIVGDATIELKTTGDPMAVAFFDMQRGRWYFFS